MVPGDVSKGPWGIPAKKNFKLSRDLIIAQNIIRHRKSEIQNNNIILNVFSLFRGINHLSVLKGDGWRLNLKSSTKQYHQNCENEMSFVTVLLAVSRVRVETILGFKIQISGPGLGWHHRTLHGLLVALPPLWWAGMSQPSGFRIGCLIEVGRTSSFNFAIQRNRFRSYLGRMNGSALLFGSVPLYTPLKYYSDYRYTVILLEAGGPCTV